MKICDLLEDTALQTLDERSYIDPALARDYKKSGHTLVGKGRDQQAWTTPAGQLVKIFGTQKGQQGLTHDQQMYLAWIDYAKKHAANPYMPRFGKSEQFEYPEGSGQIYLRVEQERLQPAQTPMGLLSQFMIFVEEGRTFEHLVQTVKTRLGPKMGGFAHLFKTTQLWDTVSELYQIAQNSGYELDLDSENYMMRGNQLVIVDPWIAS
jgi:hypothetical protein